MESHFPGTVRCGYLNAEKVFNPVQLEKAIQQQNLDVLVVKGCINPPFGYQYSQMTELSEIFSKQPITVLVDRPFLAAVGTIQYQQCERQEFQQLDRCISCFSCGKEQAKPLECIAKDGDSNTLNNEEADFMHETSGGQVLRHYCVAVGTLHKMLVLEITE